MPSTLDSSSSAKGSVTVTPHDSNALAKTTRALYVGGAGNLKVTMRDGSTPTFTAVPAGLLLPISVTHVWSTGTTATAIVGLY